MNVICEGNMKSINSVIQGNHINFRVRVCCVQEGFWLVLSVAFCRRWPEFNVTFQVGFRFENIFPPLSNLNLTQFQSTCICLPEPTPLTVISFLTCRLNRERKHAADSHFLLSRPELFVVALN